MPDCSSLCRICLKESDNIETMQALFEENNPRCTDILQQIEECGGIVLKPHEDFPKLMCQRCMDYLETSYKFRAMCQASEHALLDVIIKSELQLESMDGNSHTPTNNEYIELRGEFIDADVLDEIVEDDGVDESYCVRYSPMTTTELDEVEDNDASGPSLGVVGNREEQLSVEEQALEEEEAPDEDEDEKYDPQEDFSPKSKTKSSPKFTQSQRRSEQKNRASKKKQTTEVPDGSTRKRGRPRLCALPYTKAIKREIIEEEVKKEMMAVSNRGRKKNDDVPTSIMCEICGNIYSKPALLHVHMRRHLEDKPYECEICNKRFAGNSEVRRHMRVHTGEKPYVCRYCGRTFADRSTNIKHERIHTNERPFKCAQCGKSFTYSNVLKNHMLIHTGEKPFPCLPCNKTFSRKHQLEQHCLTLTHQTTVMNIDKLEDIEFLKVC